MMFNICYILFRIFEKSQELFDISMMNTDGS